ncbi:Fe/S biogenesis protein NfuA, partial [Bienertia sinuspersici]
MDPKRKRTAAISTKLYTSSSPTPRRNCATRFCDPNALQSLHIEDDVNWLVNNIGWGNFIKKQPPTYKKATLEFLSSLKANVSFGEGFEQGLITFRLYNQDHSWTLAQLNEVLGLPTGGPRHTPKQWDANDTWNAIVCGISWHKDGVKGNYIRHPAIRYIQRLLACTVLGRHDGGNNCKDDLYFIHHMLQAREIDTGAFLIKQMKTLANRSDTGGAIVQGGYVTLIALSLGYRELLLADGNVLGTIKEKEGTILWCIRVEVDDELLSSEAMSCCLLVIPHHHTPCTSHSVVTPSSSSAVERAINKIQESINGIKDEQKRIQEHLASICMILGILTSWIQPFPP